MYQDQGAHASEAFYRPAFPSQQTRPDPQNGQAVASTSASMLDYSAIASPGNGGRGGMMYLDEPDPPMKAFSTGLTPNPTPYGDHFAFDQPSLVASTSQQQGQQQQQVQNGGYAPSELDLRRALYGDQGRDVQAGGVSGGGAREGGTMDPTRNGDVKMKGREVEGSDDGENDDEEEADEPRPVGKRERKRTMTGGGAATTVGGIGAANEFIKRKNWSQRVVEEIQDFLHVLSPTGLFVFASPAVAELCGYRPEDLVGRSIVDFIHVDDREAYTRDFNEALRSRRELALFTRFRKKDDRYIIFEMTGHPHFVSPNPTSSPTQRSSNREDGSVCKCVFAVGRPYPSKNAAMLDSFLDLKMESERLRSKLETVYAEIEAEGGLRSLGPSAMAGLTAANGATDAFAMAVGGHQPQGGSSPGTVPRTGFDPSGGLVATQGLYPSSGNTYGMLGIGVSQARTSTAGGGGGSAIGEGDIGNAAATASQPAGGVDKKKAKKPRIDDGEFVCRDCGTVDSPEWRKGPDGPKTLCNACGLRWAKKAKTPKRGQASPKGSRSGRE